MKHNICKLHFETAMSWQIRRDEFYNFNKSRTAADHIEIDISYIVGNKAPHFGFTYERRIKMNSPGEDCTTMHHYRVNHKSEVAKLYNKFLKMHLADITGVPMYAAQNACYHIQNGNPHYAKESWRCDDDMFGKVMELWEKSHGGASLPYSEAWRGLKNALEELNFEKLWLDSAQELFNRIFDLDAGELNSAFQATGYRTGFFMPKTTIEACKLIGSDPSVMRKPKKVADIVVNW